MNMNLFDFLKLMLTWPLVDGFWLSETKLKAITADRKIKNNGTWQGPIRTQIVWAKMAAVVDITIASVAIIIGIVIKIAFFKS